MTWTKVSDDMWRHPKVRRLLDRPPGSAALGLWVATQSWIGEELSDGFIPERQPTRLMGADVASLVEELVLARLWERTVGGWTVHDYLDYNPSRAKVLADRAQRVDAGRQGGKKNAAKADLEGRRDGDGQFTTKRPLGPSNGHALDEAPSARPSGQPTPSPVSRSPDSDKPESTSPPPPSPSGVKKRRKYGTNPRATTTSLRNSHTAPRDLGVSPRGRRANDKEGGAELLRTIMARLAPQATEP